MRRLLRRALGQAFRSAIVRYAAWRGCQFVSITRRGAFGGPRGWIVVATAGLGVLYAARWSGDLAWNRRPSLGDLGRDAWKLALGLLFFAVVRALWKARRRVVIEQFADWTGTGQTEDPRGLASLLVGALSELRMLYSQVDQRPLPLDEAEERAGDTATTLIGTAVPPTKPLDATIQVEDVSQFLETTAITDSKVSVGPVQLPLGTLLGLAGRLVRGPRLIGGIHVEGGVLSLSVELASGPRVQTWRIERPLRKPEQGARIEVPHEMIEELALRMFTELALSGAVRWQATQKFVEALSSLRVCLRIRRNRRRRLIEAERSLVAALGEDGGLADVYYNLGFVYMELRRIAAADGAEAVKHAAETSALYAFQRQVELAPERWEAYYALAVIHLGRHALGELLPVCDRVIELHPGDTHSAKAHLLRGDAHFVLGNLDEAKKSRRFAAADAWAALCSAELSGERTGAARALAATALANLAGSLAETRMIEEVRPDAKARIRLRRAIRRRRDLLRAALLARRATLLAPCDSEIRYERGSVALARGNHSRAEAHFRAVLRIRPTRALAWAALAKTRAESTTFLAVDAKDRFVETRPIRYAIGKALDLVDYGSAHAETRQALLTVAAAYRALGERETARRIPERRRFFRALEAATDPYDVPTLYGLLFESRDTWERTLARVELATYELLAGGDAAAAEAELGTAIATLETEYPTLIVRRFLRARRAEALRRSGKVDQALDELRAAIGEAPLRSDEREALADAYVDLGDHEQARGHLEDALLWRPDRPDLHRKLGNSLWQLASNISDVGPRRKALRRAVGSFEHALELNAFAELEEQFSAHYWLGRLHRFLGNHDLAVSHLGRATNSAGGRVLARTLLGEAYLRAGAYPEAEAALWASVDELSALVESQADEDHGLAFDDPGWSSRRLLILAKGWLAYALAARDAHLEVAETQVGEAKDLLDGEPDYYAQAEVLRAEGVVCLKCGHEEGAVAVLQRSLDLVADAETYLNLARACRACVDNCRPTMVGNWRKRGASACRHAIELDATQQVAHPARALLAEFEHSAVPA